MLNKKGTQITEDKVSQYLEETREYIESLKHTLIQKILTLQQSKNAGNDTAEFSQV